MGENKQKYSSNITDCFRRFHPDSEFFCCPIKYDVLHPGVNIYQSKTEGKIEMIAGYSKDNEEFVPAFGSFVSYDAHSLSLEEIAEIEKSSAPKAILKRGGTLEIYINNKKYCEVTKLTIVQEISNYVQKIYNNLKTLKQAA